MWGEHTVRPYVVLENNRMIGSTGLELETPWRAMTGFVLARQDWGRGLATEIAHAMAELADLLELVRLYALCHPDNVGSARVLARAGFVREGVLRRHTAFPNMAAGVPRTWSVGLE